MQFSYFFPRLEAISFERADFLHAQALSLHAFRGLKELEFNYAKNFGDRHVQELKGCSELERLYLRSTGIKDGSAFFIARYLQNIQALDLGHTCITDATLDHLTRLPKLKNLCLTGCNLIL